MLEVEGLSSGYGKLAVSTVVARFVPAGSKLIFQMHYTPNGSPQKDRSYCGFVFADPKSVKKGVHVTSAVNAVQ